MDTLKGGIRFGAIAEPKRCEDYGEILQKKMIGKLTYLPKRGINIKLLFATLRGLCSRAYTGAGSWRRAGAEQNCDMAVDEVDERILA